MGFWSILLYRFLFAMLALAGILLLDKQSFRIRRKEILPLLLLACLYDSSAVFLFWGYQFMSSGVATTLHFMYPVLTTLIMMIFFHEKKSLWRMAAIALAVAGVFFLSGGDSTGSVTGLGIFIVLLSALGYALYLVTVSQLKNLEMKGLKMTFYVFLFGGILLFSAIGVFIGIFVKGFPLLNIWDDWSSPILTIASSGDTFTYANYFANGHFLPIFFVTVACGILSGFHSTQTAIISRTMKSEKQGRNTFYNMMVLEGFIAMVWAAGAMGVYNLALQSPEATLATGTVGVVCKYLLGHVGGIIALIGVIVLPITSGDTALRALRLSLSETMHIDQSTNGKRIRLALPIFALVIAILVWAKVNSNGFMILWRYFAWANQTLALFALMCIAVWMFENGKAKWAWMPMIPGGWYAFICVTYIANAKIGFNIPWTASYIIGVVFAIAYVVALCLYGRKRGAAVKLKMNK